MAHSINFSYNFYLIYFRISEKSIKINIVVKIGFPMDIYKVIKTHYHRTISPMIVGFFLDTIKKN